MSKRRISFKSEKWITYMLFMPCAIGFAIFYFVPFIMSLYYSLVESFFNPKFVFLQNYIEMICNTSFVLALKNTFLFTAAVLPLQMALSFILSYIADKSIKKHNLFAGAMLLPMLMPIGAFYHLSLLSFSENGIINKTLGLIGITGPNWLESHLVIWVVAFIYMWRYVGFTVLLYLVGLQTIPKVYYEIAEMEGASSWKLIKSVTLPILARIHFIVFIVCFSNSIGLFKEIYLLGGRYPQKNVYMLQHFINNSFISLDYQKLSTSCVLVTLFVITVLYCWSKLKNKYGGD